MKEIKDAIEYFGKNLRYLEAIDFPQPAVLTEIKNTKTTLATLKFVQHIQNHLEKDQMVICKWCGKTFNEFLLVKE